MKKILLSITFLLTLGITLIAQNVSIPDAALKAYLLNNTSINLNSDAEIQVSEAIAFTGTISCAGLGVTSLIGVEAFINITGLQGFSNPITGSVDLTPNTKITQLLLESTQISGVLDLSLMTNLTDVKIHSTSITAVNMANGNNSNVTRFQAHASTVDCIQTDNGFTAGPVWLVPSAASYSNTPCPQFCVINIPDTAFKSYLLGNTAINTNGDTEIQCAEASAFTGSINANGSNISDLTGLEAFVNLTTLSVESNNISTIDISANTLLEDLYCSYNNLSNLDVSSNANLETLQCTNNNLTGISIGSNNSLTFINIIANDFTSFDFTNLTALEGFRCSGNQLTSLNLSTLNSLVQLFCDSNNLSSLNVANGNNANFWTSPGGGYLFLADGNPNLACIQVDDVTFSTTNWTSIDTASSFSTNCPVFVSSIIVQGSGGDSTINTQGGTLQMFATVFPGSADDVTYTWSVTNGTGSASIDANGLLTATADGTVEVVASANDGSGVTGTKTITITNQSVGIKDIAFDFLKVYPNPTNGVLNIELQESLNSIRLMSITGQVINDFDANNRSLDISRYPSGVYFLELQNASAKSIVKVILK